MFGLVNDILEKEHVRLEKALDKIDFPHYQQIEALLVVMHLFSYDKFSRLLGVKKSIYGLKYLDTYIERNNARQQVDSFLKQLDRKKFIDKARWNIRGGVLQKDVLQERKDFIENVSQKMTEQVARDRAIFQEEAWVNNKHALVHLSAYLDADDYGPVVEAINAIPVRKEKKKKKEEDVVVHSCLLEMTQEQKDDITQFFIDNFDDLKRLCIMNDRTATLIEVELRLNRLYNKLDSAQYYHDLQGICDSRFVRDGMRFFLSSSFVAGISTSVYGLMTAAIIAGVLSVLSLTGTALAVATVICTVLFIILAPKFIYKGIHALVERIYDWYSDRLKSEMYDNVPEYKECLEKVGFFKAEKHSENTSINETESSFDSELDTSDDESTVSSSSSI